jgi:Flp pilus assembly protein TadD
LESALADYEGSATDRGLIGGAEHAAYSEGADRVTSAAVDALRENRASDAIRAAREGIAASGPTVSRLVALALAHYRSGAYHEAEGALRQALSLDNAYPLTYFLMGCTLDKLGRSPEARWHSAYRPGGCEQVQFCWDSRSPAPRAP